MSPLTAVTLLLGAVFPVCVLLCQCLAVLSRHQPPAVPYVSDAWMPLTADTTFVIAGLVAVAVATSGVLWMLSIYRPNSS